MARIEPYAAPGTFDPPTYAQAVKVTEAQTILFVAGQVAYDEDGGPAHGRDFAAQAPRMPAYTQVAVSALGVPEWLIEVEAIAIL